MFYLVFHNQKKGSHALQVDRSKVEVVGKYFARYPVSPQVTSYLKKVDLRHSIDTPLASNPTHTINVLYRPELLQTAHKTDVATTFSPGCVLDKDLGVFRVHNSTRPGDCGAIYHSTHPLGMHEGALGSSNVFVPFTRVMFEEVLPSVTLPVAEPITASGPVAENLTSSDTKDEVVKAIGPISLNY